VTNCDDSKFDIIMQPATVVCQQPMPVVSSQVEQHKKTLKNLGITEIVLCCIELVFGIVLIIWSGTPVDSGFGFSGIRFKVYLPSIGEGIWTSVLPLVAGILALKAGGAAPGIPVNRCMLQAHMALAILGCFGQFILMCIEITYSIATGNAYSDQQVFTAFLAIIAISSFINFIILIVSASYSCKLIPGCGCCGESEPPQIVQPIQPGQLVYVGNAPQVGYVGPQQPQQQQPPSYQQQETPMEKKP